MKLNSKRVVLHVGLVLAFLLFTAVPAFAATKLIDFKLLKVSIPLEDVFGSLPEEICGVAGPFHGDLFIQIEQFTLWDNDHYRFHGVNSVRLYDSEENLVLRDQFVIHDVAGSGSLPVSFAIKLVSRCTPYTGMPGKLYEAHYLTTVGEDGTIIHTHGELCDPEAYPFC